MGLGGTWRWRFRTGDKYHHRFWGQVVRWAASTRLVAGNPFVRFGPAKAHYVEGERIEIDARISEGTSGVGPELLVAAKIYTADPKTGGAAGDLVAVMPLRSLPGQPRMFGGDALSLPAGRYVIRLDVAQLAQTLGQGAGASSTIPEATFEVGDRETSERVELAATRDQVEHLAAATAGRVFSVHEAAELAPLLRARTKRTTRVVETPLWDQPAFLLVFLGILTVEWVARKTLGLP